VTLEVLAGVLADDLEEPALGAALRHGDRHRPVAPTSEPRREHLEVVWRLGHQDPRRHLVALHVQLSQERRQQLRAVELLDTVDHPALAPHHPAPPDEEDLERGLQVVLDHADDVEVLGLGEHHLLALHRPARGGQLVAQLGGVLVLLSIGRLPHLAIEPLHDRSVVAGQEVGQGVDMRAVGLVRHAGDLRYARSGAATDVVVQAGPTGAPPLVEERVRARSYRKHAGGGVERLTDRVRVPERTEVPDLLPLGAAQDLGPRPLLADRQGQVRIGLVVAVANVEARPVLLDQVVLEQQRVDLAGRHDPLDRPGGGRHGLRAGMERFAPVRGQALS
jgi:hypothetical protein